MNRAVKDVLSFWFGATGADPGAITTQRKLWFGTSRSFDAQIRQRFGGLLQEAKAGELMGWRESAEGTLALIIVLDQFSRNVFRGQPRAFAQDAYASRLTLEGVTAGLDTSLCEVERAFFYMPLQHAEDAGLQQQSINLYNRLKMEARPQYQEAMQDFLRYAEEHHDIVERFGRFPHRNQVLGRETTDAERMFLQEHKRDYGQAAKPN